MVWVGVRPGPPLVAAPGRPILSVAEYSYSLLHCPSEVLSVFGSIRKVQWISEKEIRDHFCQPPPPLKGNQSNIGNLMSLESDGSIIMIISLSAHTHLKKNKKTMKCIFNKNAKTYQRCFSLTKSNTLGTDPHFFRELLNFLNGPLRVPSSPD